jgi:hypothetical protein
MLLPVDVGSKNYRVCREPLKRIAIAEWQGLEKAPAFRNLDACKNLALHREKAVKIISGTRHRRRCEPESVWQFCDMACRRRTLKAKPATNRTTLGRPPLI